MAISFYDLDYIIEANQKRLEEYNASLQKVMERFTNIILIYSGLGIFLVPLIQHILDADIKTVSFYIFFILFSVCWFRLSYTLSRYCFLKKSHI